MPASFLLMQWIAAWHGVGVGAGALPTVAAATDGAAALSLLHLPRSTAGDALRAVVRRFSTREDKTRKRDDGPVHVDLPTSSSTNTLLSKMAVET